MAIKNPSAIGQAINLAAADAREHGKESDVTYIYKRYVFWSALCEVIQSSDIDMIQEVIGNKDFDKLVEQIKILGNLPK